MHFKIVYKKRKNGKGGLEDGGWLGKGGKQLVRIFFLSNTAIQI